MRESPQVAVRPWQGRVMDHTLIFRSAHRDEGLQVARTHQTPQCLARCVDFCCCCSLFSTFEFAARHKVVCMLTAVRGSGKPMMNNPQLSKPRIIVLRWEARFHHAIGNKAPKRAESTTAEERPLVAAQKSRTLGSVRILAGPEPGSRAKQIRSTIQLLHGTHPRRRAPSGSNSGSVITFAARLSPRISISTVSPSAMRPVGRNPRAMDLPAWWE